MTTAHFPEDENQRTALSANFLTAFHARVQPLLDPPGEHCCGTECCGAPVCLHPDHYEQDEPPTDCHCGHPDCGAC